VVRHPLVAEIVKAYDRRSVQQPPRRESDAS